MNRREMLAGMTVVGSGLLGAGSVLAAAKKKKPVAAWSPLEFPISFWCGPPEPHITLEQYRRIREGGFNYVMPPCSGATRETNLKSLDLAKQTGLKVFVSDGRIPANVPADEAGRKALDAALAEYSRHPALAGYFVGDEPSRDAFPALGRIAAYIRERDPRHPVYINLYPNYAPASVLGPGGYDAYLEGFIEAVHPFTVSYDHYHFTNHGDRPTFFSNLESARRVSQKHGLPFWQIVLITQHFDYRKLKEGETRYEAMQTLAYGAKGLMYFTYWTPDASSMWKEGIIQWDGTPSYHYDQVRRVNRDVQTIGRELLLADSTHVYQTGTLPTGGTPAPAAAPVRTVAPGVEVTVGIFARGRQTLALIANRDYRTERMMDLRFTTGGERLEQLDLASGKWKKAGNQQPNAYYVGDLRLSPGGAELFRWGRSGAEEWDGKP